MKVSAVVRNLTIPPVPGWYIYNIITKDTRLHAFICPTSFGPWAYPYPPS